MLFKFIKDRFYESVEIKKIKRLCSHTDAFKINHIKRTEII